MRHFELGAKEQAPRSCSRRRRRLRPFSARSPPGRCSDDMSRSTQSALSASPSWLPCAAPLGRGPLSSFEYLDPALERKASGILQEFPILSLKAVMAELGE